MKKSVSLVLIAILSFTFFGCAPQETEEQKFSNEDLSQYKWIGTHQILNRSDNGSEKDYFEVETDDSGVTQITIDYYNYNNKEYCTDTIPVNNIVLNYSTNETPSIVLYDISSEKYICMINVTKEVAEKEGLTQYVA